MSSVSNSVGVFTGIDRNQIIGQLLALQQRPKTLAQRRIAGFQTQQAALLDVSSKVGSLRTLAQSFRTDNVFTATKATSSVENVVQAVTGANAATGTYSVTVARLASTQQSLSRAFSDQNVTGLGLNQITLESPRGRLVSETELSQLNGGAGIQRGKIIVTDSNGTNTTVDLSRALTVSDVVRTINQTSGIRVQARVDGDRLVVDDQAGGTGTLRINSEGGVRTAEDLGIAGNGTAGRITGTVINTLGRETALRALNDGLGVTTSAVVGPQADFSVTLRDGSNFEVDIGDVYSGATRTASAATTLGQVVDRINSAGAGKVTASIDGTSGRLVIADNTAGAGNTVIADLAGSGVTTASDLGISGTFAGGTVFGRRLNSEINSVQTSRLLGGSGLLADEIRVTTRGGDVLFLNGIDTSGSINDFIDSFNNEPTNAGKVRLSLDDSGNRFVITDNTTGSGQLEVVGGAADQLGLSGTFATGRAVSNRAQRQFVGNATPLSDLNFGRGVGTGQIEINTSTGRKFNINIGSVTNVGDLIRTINSGLVPATGTADTRARLNDTGDGIVIEDISGGANRISIRDVNGTVARNLNLVGTAEGTGVSNRVNGSSERTIALDVADTLQTVSRKINEAGFGVTASVVNDGSATPFRLSVTSRNSGAAGAVSIDTGGVDIGLRTLTEGSDALVFYGTDNASTALTFRSSTNSVSGAIPGVTLNLLNTSAQPISVAVTNDGEKVIDKVKELIAAYNEAVESIDSRSKYDADSNKRGELLGDTLTSELRQNLQTLISGRGQGVNSQFQFLFEVGVQVGRGAKLELKEDKLRRAIEADPRGVAELFSGRVQNANQTRREISPGVFVTENTAGTFSTKGVLEIMADTLETYVGGSNARFTRRSQLIDTQIKTQNDAISAVDTRIASRRATLERQFIAMERTIGQLQNQSGSINNIRTVQTGR